MDIYSHVLQKVEKEAANKVEEFEQSLTPEQIRQRNQLLDIQSKIHIITLSETYEIGFCDGANIMLDVLSNAGSTDRW